MIVDQKLKESEISEQDSLLSKHFARTRNLPRIAIFNISYIRGLFPEKYFNDKSVPALDHTQDPAENEQQLARVKNWISLRHTDNVELTDVLSNFTYISMILTEEIMDKLVQDGYLLKPGRDTYTISKTKASECEFSAVKEEMDGQVVPHGDKALQNVGEDYTYTKALYHALPMDYVTVAKLQNKLEGEGNQTTVRKLFDKISREGYIEAKSNQRPGVYDALQKNYLRSLLFCNCETLEGPMIQEYTFSFSYSNSDNQEVSMNINSTCTKEGTFNCGSLTEVTPNQMRSSACNMVRILIQWMRTLDKMPEQVNQPQEDLEGEAEQVEGEAEMEGVGGEEIGGEGGQGDGDGSDNEGEEIGGEWGSDDDGDDSDDNGDDSDDDEDNNNEEEAEEEEEAEAEVVDEQGAVLDDQQQGNVAQCPPQSWKDVRALKAKADQAFDDSRNFFHLGRDNPDYVKAKRKAIETMLEHHEAMLRVFFHGEVHDDAIVGAAVVPIGGEATEETNGVVEEGVGAAVEEVVPTVVVEEQVLAPVVAAEKLVEEEAVEEDIVPDMLFNNKGNFCGESSAKRKR